ncbi:hypothetical protein DL98DRAFT_532069 [Cadophora sp. DSE1049]|nr:hypothetical protein DL98DRAFT_532069 [Cadophora sp. DSE1049]
MTNNTFPTVYMHLQLNTSSPDPIGFGNVSGFYGPGAWGAWFLTYCASWYSLCAHKTGLNANTWFYVIALNGAAVDHLRHLYALSALKFASDPGWIKEAASIGAAFTITWWGHCGILLQLFAIPFLSAGSVPAFWHGFVLVIGTLVPALSTVTIYWLVDDEIGAHIPALYWKGMSLNPAIGWNADRFIYYFTVVLGFWSLGTACSILILYCAHGIRYQLPEFWEETCKLFTDVFMFLKRMLWPRLSSPRQVGAFNPDVLKLVYSMVETLLMFIFMLPPVMSIWFFLIGVCMYINAAYFTKGSSPSQTCFFMPCAPQSIAELDQALGLTAGIFSFFVVEVGYPYLQRKKRQRRERREFEQETARRFELLPMPADEQTEVLVEAIQQAAGTSHTPVGVSGRDTWAAGTRRVNSGIVVEEGRA